jgi:hypothetical protein
MQQHCRICWTFIDDGQSLVCPHETYVAQEPRYDFGRVICEHLDRVRLTEILAQLDREGWDILQLLVENAVGDSAGEIVIYVRRDRPASSGLAVSSAERGSRSVRVD